MIKGDEQDAFLVASHSEGRRHKDITVLQLDKYIIKSVHGSCVVPRRKQL